MTVRLRNISILCLGLLLIASCARIGIPEGGAKDETPPELVAKNSEPNFQTNFDKKKFSFEFNEWINLQNPIKEVVVSPPTSYPIQVSEKGKKVVFEFSEEEDLKENTTYQINFGDAIKDFTEGNIYPNFIFVFSTGDVIDSLSVQGQVKDVITNQGESDILVVLYDDLSDTCFTSTKPYYFTKTDEAGNFKLSNLRNDTFQMFALKDANVNYFYDLPAEKVGFIDSLLITSDTSNVDFEITLFDEEDEPRLISFKQESKGLIKVNYFPIPFEYSIDFENKDSVKYFTEELNDTLFIWHNDLVSDSSDIYITLEQRIDTIQNKRAKQSIGDVTLKPDKKQKKQVSVLRADSISIEFNKAILSVDTSLLELSDTLKSFDLNQFKIDKRSAHFWFDSLKIDQEYTMQILPNAITDWYGKLNEDTLVYEIKIINPEKLGILNLSFSGADTLNYVVDLISNEVVVRKFTISDDQDILLNNLSPGSYKLKIVEDINGDGRWSPGVVKLKRHSEKIKEVPLDDVKPNWEFELEVNLKEIFYGTEGN